MAAIVGFTLFAVAREVSAEIYVWNALVCLGVGLVLAATPVLTMGDVPPERTAESAVANSTIRYVGSALGAQVAASIVAAPARLPRLHSGSRPARPGGHRQRRSSRRVIRQGAG